MRETEDILEEAFSDDVLHGEIQEEIVEDEIPEKPKRSRKKKIVIPEGAHPLLAWRLEKSFDRGELSALINIDVKTIYALEHSKYEPTEEQKKKIRTMTGIKL